MDKKQKDLLETWYDRYGNELYRTLCSAMGDTDVPEEILQETFFKTATYLSRADKHLIQNPRAFLYKVAYNELYSRQRRARLEKHLQQVLDEPSAKMHETVTPEDIALSREELDNVRRLIEQLPKKQRTVLTLSRIRNMTHAQIAELLGIRKGSVKQHIVRALATLRGAGHG